MTETQLKRVSAVLQVSCMTSCMVAGVAVKVAVTLEHSQESEVSSRESGASSPEVDLLSNESFSWHPSSHSEEEDFDE